MIRMLYEGRQLLYGNGNYIMYLRKSRKDYEAEQRGEGDTLTRHFNLLDSLARQMRINITVVLEEIVSGDTIAARPKMQQLLRLVESCAYDGVLVIEVERLSRGDTSDQGIVAKTFKYSGTKIVTPLKIYDPEDEYDEEYFEFGLFMSRREYKTIKRRLQRGRHASRSEGKYTGSVAPYGYKRIKLKGEKGFSLEIIPEEAEVVQIIFNLADRGDENGTRLGRTKIADYLNNHGYRKNGELWNKSMVTTIMINEIYKGYIADGKRKSEKNVVNGVVVISAPRNKNCQMYKGLHEPIISEEQFDRVQQYTRSRCNSSLNLNKELQNSLSGLVFCSCCNRQMQRTWDKKRPAFIACLTKDCSTVATYQHILEKRVLDALKLWISDYQITPEEISLEIDEKSHYESNIETLQKELDELEKQLENTYALLERGIYSEEMFLKRNSAVQKEVDSTRLQLDALNTKLQELISSSDKKLSLVPKMQSIVDCYYSIESAAGRNDLLKEVIERIEYEKLPENRGQIDNFTIRIYPKLK